MLQIVTLFSGGFLLYLSWMLRLRFAVLVGCIEALLAALAWSEHWPDPDFLPVGVSAGIFLAFAWAGVLGAAVVAIRLLFYLGQDLPRLTKRT